mgnify:CR=1 FL=1
MPFLGILAILGVVILSLFGALFARLWYLQVLTGDDLRREALDNRVRKVALEDLIDRKSTRLNSSH